MNAEIKLDYQHDYKKSHESSQLQLALIIRTGKYSCGINQAIRQLKDGKAKLIIFSNNLPHVQMLQLKYYAMQCGVKTSKYPNNSREFGTALGKNYNVSVMTISDAGDADINVFH